MTKPVVTVVVTTFDRPIMLRRSLQSVADQTFSDYEVIIVNDHPQTAATVDAAVEDFDGRFRLIHNPRNLGPAGARNRGLAEARGELVAVLDDDDAWLPQFLAQHVAAHQEHPEAVVVYSGYRTESSEAGLRSREVPAPPPPADALAEMLSGRFTFATSSILTFRTEAVVAVGGYDPNLLALEDWDLACRLLRVGKAISIPEPMSLYNEHFGFRVSANASAALAEIRRKWANTPGAHDFVRRHRAEILFNASRASVLTGHRWRGWLQFGRFLVQAHRVSNPRRSIGLLLILNVGGARVYRRLQARSTV